MPELPEVETVTRQLQSEVASLTLRKVTVLDPKLTHLNKLKPGLIKDVTRVGKYICFDIGSFLVIHLRMTGRVIVSSEKSSYSKYARALFHLSSGVKFEFSDVRRFGTCEIVEDLGILKKGVEPLSREFTTKKLKELIGSSNQQIKVWLLRQDKIVGIGNIYASEILYASRISPFKSASSLTEEELRLLCREAKRILRKAIKNCGTTFSDFQDSTGKIGNYQNISRHTPKIVSHALTVIL